MEPWELVARESIRDLVARYNANGDTGRFDQVLELFAPDAVMQLDDREYVGHEDIRSIFTHAAGAVTGAPRIQHHTATLQIDVTDPEHASGRSYFQVLAGEGLDHWGRYLDRYVVAGGRWRFARRRVVTDGWVPGGWGERVMRSGGGGR